MEINYHTIIHGDSKAYPARIATVVNLAGTPFQDPFALNLKNTPYEKTSISELLQKIVTQREEDAETTAVVFTCGEIGLQANALQALAIELQRENFKIKIDTNGFYPEETKNLLPYVNYISLQIKTQLDAIHYSKILGTMPFDTYYSRLVRTFAFLEKATAMREITTPVIGGLNNKKNIVESIAKEITPFADVYVLEQWSPNTDYAHAAGYYVASRQELLELAASARNIFPKVNIRALQVIEQELIHHQVKK